jgi:hypothetical protein
VVRIAVGAKDAADHTLTALARLAVIPPSLSLGVTAAVPPSVFVLQQGTHLALQGRPRDVGLLRDRVADDGVFHPTDLDGLLGTPDAKAGLARDYTFDKPVVLEYISHFASL